MKKSTKKTKREERNQQAPPLGLIAMMSLVREDSETSTAAESNARRAYPVARRLIRDLRTSHGDASAALDGACAAMFPGLDDEPFAAQTGAQAGFYVGVAVAWLLLQDVNGGAR